MARAQLSEPPAPGEVEAPQGLTLEEAEKWLAPNLGYDD